MKALLIPILCLFTSSFSYANEQQIVREESRIVFPENYAQKKEWPLVVLLHAYKVGGGFQEAYFGLGSQIKKEGFVLLVPGSTKDSKGQRFWNATDYCCNHFDSPVDDVSYLHDLILKTKSLYKIDPQRVYLIGHSNGAFMAQRLMCDYSELFSAVVSLSGAGTRLDSQCALKSPVSFLEIHSLNDAIVPYAGMNEDTLRERLKKKPLYPYANDPLKVRYASTPDHFRFIAQKNGCDPGSLTHEAPKKYAHFTFEKETEPLHFTRCKNQTETALWTLKKGGHVPLLNHRFRSAMLEFLFSHKKVD